MSDETVKYLLPESEIPTHWINLLPDLPGEPLPPLHPGTLQPAGPDDLTPIFPMSLILQEVSRRAAGRDPRARPRRLQAVAPDAAVPRPPLGARARYPRSHLLQVRGRLARRITQAQHRRRAGLRERTGRDQAAVDRDRRRAVGLRARVRVFAVRPRVRGVHGRLELRPEALSPLDDPDVGRDRAPLAVGSDAGRQGQRRPSDGVTRDRDLRGRRGRRPARRHQLLARLGAQPRVPAPDGHRAGSDRADGDGGRAARRGRRLRRRRVELRRPDVPVHPRGAARQRQDAVPRDRADRLPDAHPGRLPLRLRRHRRADAADADVHAGPRLRAPAGARRRAALPRRRADAVRAGQGRRRRGEGLPPERHLRRGGAVRPRRGDHPRARARARDQGRASTRPWQRARPAKSA